jgi:RNA polymerase sigma-70 factor (ECF subfamily)
VATDHAGDADLHLFARARGGDFDAFSQLVSRLQCHVFAAARRITGREQDAEDVTQQTFLSVLEHLDGFRGESSVATWVSRIATNHALKVLRKRRRLPTSSLDDDRFKNLPHPEYIASWRDTPEALAERAEVRYLLDEALAELDEKYRVVFVLRDVEGLSVRETAEALGLTETAVKVRLLRARLQLRERLTKSLGDEATRIIPDHSHE